MKHLFVVLALLVASTAFSQVIPNAGFEFWGGSPSGPTDWLVSNAAGSPSVITVAPVNDVHSGALAARGAVIDVEGFGYPASMHAGADGAGFPTSARHEALHGWYKFTSVGGDHLQIASPFRLGRVSLGSGFFTALTTTTVYREFVANTIWSSSLVPDTGMININIMSTSGTWHVGTAFVVDDLSYGPVTDVKESGTAIPSAFALEQNYPNPFNPETKIQFSIPDAQFVMLKVYNPLGQEVATLVNEQMEAGNYRAEFDASSLPSGTYIYRLSTLGFSSVKKMTLVR